MVLSRLKNWQVHLRQSFSGVKVNDNSYQDRSSSTQLVGYSNITHKITWYCDLYFFMISLFLEAVGKCRHRDSEFSISSTILDNSRIARKHRWCFLTAGSMDKWWQNTVTVKHSVGNFGSCQGGLDSFPEKIINKRWFEENNRNV
jgi:hypothetical protein